MENDVSSVMMLLGSIEERVQLAALGVLATVSFESPVRQGGGQSQALSMTGVLNCTALHRALHCMGLP